MNDLKTRGILVISNNWSEGFRNCFLRSLKRNDIFGFSSSFTKEEIKTYAAKQGMSVADVSEHHPLSKGVDRDYILRVTSSAKSRKAQAKKSIFVAIDELRLKLDNLEQLILSGQGLKRS